MEFRRRKLTELKSVVVLRMFILISFREQEEDRLFDAMIAAKGLFLA